jgi:hypothetical protein
MRHEVTFGQLRKSTVDGIYNSRLYTSTMCNESSLKAIQVDINHGY